MLLMLVSLNKEEGINYQHGRNMIAWDIQQDSDSKRKGLGIGREGSI